MSITSTLKGRFAAEHRPYECVTCHARFAHQHHVCPDCGGFSVERVDWDC